MSIKTVALAEGAKGIFIKNDRFKTTLMSFNFYLPLKKETVASYALLPFILTSCSKKYPDFSKLNYKLSKLYGARLDASTEKYGDYQLLKMTVSLINDRYSLDDESLVKRAAELLLGLVFEPNTENGAFLDLDLEREKRKAIEHIKGELSEKRVYAKNQMIKEMFKDDVYGLSKCGTVEQVQAITGESLYKSWEKMLESAFITVQVVGTAIPTGLFEEISERFSSLKRENITDCKDTCAAVPTDKVNTVTEEMNVNQGKLVMGFTTELQGNDDKTLPLMVMTDIFGGGPYSRLFSNVREKMSLCYYCSASSSRIKGVLTVDSGVEADNAEKAEKEILNQLEIVKRGEFTDSEFQSSIKSISDSVKTYSDSLGALDLWYALRVHNDNIYSPEEMAEKIATVTREDVIKAANGVKLHTIYKLMPKEKK